MASGWTESKVFAKLRGRFRDPAFLLLPQVRNGTGYQRSRIRTADALAVSLYPSRGLYFVGVEIKVSRSDWLKELDQPEKSSDIQRFCRFWYVATPKNVIEPGEVPETWGHLEVSNNVREKKRAPKLDESPPDMLIVCSVLRSLDKLVVPRAELNQRVDEKVEELRKRMESRNDRSSAEGHLEQLRTKVREFENAAGVEIAKSWNAGRVGDAVRRVLHADDRSRAASVQAKRLLGNVDTLRTALAEEIRAYEDVARDEA